MSTCPICETSCDDGVSECPTCDKVLDGSMSSNAAALQPPPESSFGGARAIDSEALHSPPKGVPTTDQVRDWSPPGPVRCADSHPHTAWAAAKPLLRDLSSKEWTGLDEEQQVFIEQLAALASSLDEGERQQAEKRFRELLAPAGYSGHSPPWGEWRLALGRQLLTRWRRAREMDDASQIYDDIDYDSASYNEVVFFKGVYAYFDQAGTLYLGRNQGTEIRPGGLLAIVYDRTSPAEHETAPAQFIPGRVRR